MDISAALKGFVIGFGIAAPVGPIGLLCIQRTLNEGRLIGLATGLGAASADALYGLVAALGLTIVSAFLVDQAFWLGLVGGLFLLYLGAKTLMTPPAQQAAEAQGNTLIRAYATTLALTLTNPMTILAFVAIFAGAGLAAGAANATQAVLMVLGVFAGSATWWLLLSGGVSLLRSRFTPTTMVWVNRGAGAVLVAFGVYAVASVLV